MLICQVVGSIISTRKHDKLIGNKFLIVEPIDIMKTSTKQLVAIDNIGAGIGEIVLVVQGSAARILCESDKTPVDAAIVGIVDEESFNRSGI